MTTQRLIKTAVLGLCMLLHVCPGMASGAADPYMVVDLATGSVVFEDGTAADYTNDVYKTTKMAFRKVPAGTYAVQNGTVQATMEKDYYIGVYEVTVGQFKLMQNPEASVTATTANMKPKASSYNAVRGTRAAAADPTASSPIGKLTARTSVGKFDLPTEAMWEVAARAMSAGDNSHASWPWYFGTSSATLADYAWYLGNSSGATHVVGLKLPNAWGLYDMYGNVSEWCRDHWSRDDFVPTQAGNTTDTDDNRSLRGGSYESGGNDCSSGGRLNAYYTSSEATYGFRLALAATDDPTVNLDIDNDGQPDVIVTPTGDGSITDNGDGSYDVTGAAQIELPAADGVIDVPTNVTVTVGADGVTALDADETVTLTVDNGDGTTTVTTVNGPAAIGPDGTITLDEDYKALEEAFGGNAGISYDPETGTWIVTVTNDITGPVVVPDVDAVEINLNGNTIAGPDGDETGNAAAPDGLPAIVLEGTNTTLSITGTGTVSGGNGADETLGEDGHAAGDGAPAICVPDGFAGTVTAESGVTVTGGSGGNAVDPESDPGSGAASGLSNDTTPAPDGAHAPAQISEIVAIREWQPLGGDRWRLVFDAPAQAIKGRLEQLKPDRSFSLQCAASLEALSNGGTGCTYLPFEIDDASEAGGLTTLTLTVAAEACKDAPILFVRVVSPSEP